MFYLRTVLVQVGSESSRDTGQGVVLNFLAERMLVRPVIVILSRMLKVLEVVGEVAVINSAVGIGLVVEAWRPIRPCAFGDRQLGVVRRSSRRITLGVLLRQPCSR